VEYRRSRGRIDDSRRERCAGVAEAHESVECLCFVVGLYPGANSQRVTIGDVSFEDRFVGYEYFRAAIRQNAAHFGE
jgi:hypothetical protein